MPLSRNNSPDFLLRAENVSGIILESCETGVLNLIDALFGKENADDNDGVIESLFVELLAFALNITDRLAFAELGSEDRAEFMDEILSAVQNGLQSPVSSEFQEIYKTRNEFYGSFQKLFAEETESLKGTLFWEFGKAMGAVYCNSNPVAVTEVTIFAHSFYVELAKAF